MFDVITFGTATLDVFLRSPGMEVETNNGEKDICVRHGAKLEVNEIYFESGGGGTNSAITFARQGLKVASVVQIGSDFAGEKVLADLSGDGVDVGLVDVEKSIYTDYSTILWAGDGGRTILIYRGSTKLEVENVPWEKLDTKWFYVSSLEGNLEIVKRLAELGKPIAWNPGGRELKQREEVFSLLPHITQLNVNKEEMMELLEVEKINDIKDLLKEAQKLPCRYVVITDDRRGAYLWNREAQVWWHSGIFEDSKRFETTGAGDSFGSGLVSGLIKGETLENCLYLAAANSSSVVSQVGAKKGILQVTDLHSWPREKLLIEKING
ncbi:MAG: carbohydrate kinase family protein [Patescibacteria group bacterium]|jgi:sugar/nucleoside kinase (ribokinase family)